MLDKEFSLVSALIVARTRAGLTQEQVGHRRPPHFGTLRRGYRVPFTNHVSSQRQTAGLRSVTVAALQRCFSDTYRAVRVSERNDCRDYFTAPSVSAFRTSATLAVWMRIDSWVGTNRWRTIDENGNSAGPDDAAIDFDFDLQSSAACGYIK